MLAGTRFVAVWLVWVTLSCAPMPDLANGRIRGVVMVSTPVRGATVIAWRLDPDTGERLEQIAEVRSDSRSGEFSFDIGTAHGTIEVQAIGGSTVSLAMATVIALDHELRAVLVDVEAGAVRDVAVTPYSTIAAALGKQRRVQSGGDYVEAMRRAYELMGNHLGIDLGRTLPADMRESVALDARGRYGVALAAWSGLAARIARESVATDRGYNSLDLLLALVADATGNASLDGRGPGGVQIRTGACVLDPACTTCPTVCDLDSNTLRADLGAALVYEFIMTPANSSGLEPGDVLPIVEAWRSNGATELFGSGAIEPITGEPPAVLVGTSTIDNESADLIMFPEPATAVPMHAASGIPIVLGPGETCEIVYKHVTRLDDPLDNPVRWVFSVAGAGIVPDSGEYRVGIREQAGVRWLTGWVPAVQRASVTNGYEYEVILLRSTVPALGTEQGTYEIEFRGRDGFGQTGTAGRCWQHAILPPRLWYSTASTPPGTVSRSLHSVNLHPGNNLAPLLNGVGVAEGKALMEIEIRNGTTEPAYVTFAFDQAVASYQKRWRDDYALLIVDAPPEDPACLGNGTCPDVEPPAALIVDEQGTIVDLVNDLAIWDVIEGAYLQPCQGCSPGKYRLEPRLSLVTPRRYRVMLIATELGGLAPLLAQGDTEAGPFEDFVLDPVLPLLLTGVRYDRYEHCTRQEMGLCIESKIYRHYRALTAVSLTIPWLRIVGRSSAAPDIPAPLTEERELSDFAWMSAEPTIPVRQP
jgi:hypothetical protein